MVKKIIKWACKLFFLWLMVQFFLQTYITYKLEYTGWIWTFVWMWKEFLILLFGGVVLYTLLSQLPRYLADLKKENKNLTFSSLFQCFKTYSLWQFVVLLIGTTLLCILIAFLFQHSAFKAFFLSFKYDLLPLWILGIGIGLGYFYFTEKDEDVLSFYRKMIRWVLWLWIFWWFVVYFGPQWLRHLWYSPYTPEALVWQAPPAAYYTNIYPHFENSYVRNSFLFERPITFWFWLVAFFPFFFFVFLRKNKRFSQIFLTFLYGLLVFSTWSRAALALWILELVAVIVLLNWKFFKQHLLKILIICLIGGVGVAYVGRGIFARDYSNTWHVILIVEGWKLAKEKLFSWWGIWYAGPASHQLCARDLVGLENPLEFSFSEKHPDERCETIRKINNQYDIKTFGYNPENQYLQILMEYGIFGLLGRGCCLLWMVWYSFVTWKKYHSCKKTKFQELLYFTVIWAGIWLVWLCMEGMVLHSLTDRMVVYPFFLLYGMSIGMWEKEKKKIYLSTEK